MNARYILILSLALMAGCSPKVIPFQRDSTVVRIKDSIVFHDSIILVPIENEETSNVRPLSDTSKLFTRYSESEAYISEGKLHHSLRNRSEALIPVEVKMPKIIHTEHHAFIREKLEKVEVEKQLSMWQKFIMALGYGLLGGFVVWLGIRIQRLVERLR